MDTGTLKSKRKDIDGIGEVLFERSARARYINISVRAGGIVRVAVPIGVPLGRAEKVLTEKRDWVKKHQRKLRESEHTQKAMLANISSSNTAEARKVIRDRLAQLAARHGFKYNRVFIRNQKTRWGSCSSRSNINLNIKLVFLPQELMDYVILHELVHTKVRNHSPEFWKMLDQYVPGAKAMDKQLKKYSLRLLEAKLDG
ncbi:MAG: SprT family zinc-dependent metalloprotease [candidate division KSB1 bacterium]|nr:SprT family zinc-dependent metalloprotease [candidate division KSB1 bacterium]